MDQKILNKTITISEVVKKQTTGGNKYAIKDHEGRTFNFFTTKKDGEDTSVYAQFKNMELAVGSTVMIGYVEEEFEVQGKKVISKKIINFRETNEEPSQTAPRRESSNSGHSVASGAGSNDAFGRRLAIHGMVNGLLASGVKIEDVTYDTIVDLLSLESVIDHTLAEPSPKHWTRKDFETDEDKDLPEF